MMRRPVPERKSPGRWWNAQGHCCGSLTAHSGRVGECAPGPRGVDGCRAFARPEEQTQPRRTSLPVNSSSCQLLIDRIGEAKGSTSGVCVRAFVAPTSPHGLLQIRKSSVAIGRLDHSAVWFRRKPSVGRRRHPRPPTQQGSFRMPSLLPGHIHRLRSLACANMSRGHTPFRFTDSI